jgi:hypothetical protein
MISSPVGILMLDTRFPRPLGDIGHPETFEFPVLHHVVSGASPTRVVEQDATGLVERFREGARTLERQGVRAIGTSCGFLALHQVTLAGTVRVPVFTSSLIQIPPILSAIDPERKVGVLTMRARSLTPAHFEAVGVGERLLRRVTIAGLERAEALYRPIMENRESLDVELARVQVVDAARQLVGRHPDVAALVLECTNLPPYAAAIQRATGLPIWDAVTLIRWAHIAVSDRLRDHRTASSTSGTSPLAGRRC